MRALSAEKADGAWNRIRTCCLMIISHPLYPMSYPRIGAIDRTRTGSGFLRCPNDGLLVYVQRNAKPQSGPRQPVSCEPMPSCAKERAYDRSRRFAQALSGRRLALRLSSRRGVIRSTRFRDDAAAFTGLFLGKPPSGKVFR